MKTMKLILLAILLSGLDTVVAQSEWKTTTEKFNGNEYVIQYTELTYSVTNKEYTSFVKDATSDIELEGETIDELSKRRNQIRGEIYRVLDRIMDFNQLRQSKKEWGHLTLVCFFDSHTKDYKGASFIFDTEWKDVFTLQKVNTMESSLSQAHLNAGRTNLLEDKDYFTITIMIPIGKKD